MSYPPVTWEDIDELRITASTTRTYPVRKGSRVKVRGLGPAGWHIVRLQRRSDGEAFAEVAKGRGSHGRVVNATQLVYVRQPK
jgi:hypothetical protein